jgi:hypothetical protein
VEPVPLRLPADSLIPGAKRAQEARWAGWGSGPCPPDLGDDHAGGGGTDPGDLIEPADRLAERGDLRFDLGLEVGDVGGGLIDAGQHRGEQEGVMVGEVADERLLQQADLGAHAGAGQLREHLRVPLARDERGHHGLAGDAEDVSGDHAQLDLGVLQQLLDAVFSAVQTATRSAR